MEIVIDPFEEKVKSIVEYPRPKGSFKGLSALLTCIGSVYLTLPVHIFI